MKFPPTALCHLPTPFVRYLCLNLGGEKIRWSCTWLWLRVCWVPSCWCFCFMDWLIGNSVMKLLFWLSISTLIIDLELQLKESNLEEESSDRFCFEFVCELKLQKKQYNNHNYTWLSINFKERRMLPLKNFFLYAKILLPTKSLPLLCSKMPPKDLLYYSLARDRFLETSFGKRGNSKLSLGDIEREG